MALKQEDALLTGLATAAVVYAVYQTHLPTVAGVRASKPGNKAVEASRKQATVIAVGVVAGISLLARSPTVFVIGGAMVIGLDVVHRMANATDNTTGKVVDAGTDATAAPVTGS
jgi:hypothetical protein